jgi:RimJ/RimL family protein N-acetyltransferase
MSSDEQSVFLVITARRTSRVVGYIQLTRIDPWHGHAELGICLTPESRGRGYGREALQLMEDYGGAVLGLRKIHLRALAHHAPAVGLYRSTGYRAVGTLRGHFRHGGTWHDVVLMEKQVGGPPRSKSRG